MNESEMILSAFEYRLRTGVSIQSFWEINFSEFFSELLPISLQYSRICQEDTQLLGRLMPPLTSCIRTNW